MADKVKFRELLGVYRTRCGWSQSELGMKIGVHRNTIALWESGDRSPQSRGEVLRLADELLLSKEEHNEFLKAAGLSEERWPADYWNVPYPRIPTSLDVKQLFNCYGKCWFRVQELLR